MIIEVIRLKFLVVKIINEKNFAVFFWWKRNIGRNTKENYLFVKVEIYLLEKEVNYKYRFY